VSRTATALEDLELGLLPSDLADAGPGEALRRLADRSPLHVDLRLEGLTSAAPVDTAAYFVCAQAMANAVRYAAASRVEVVVTVNGDVMTVRLTDDGRGGAVAHSAGGLQGLEDRVGALAGVSR